MTNKERIGIVAWGSSSPLGGTISDIWSSYQDNSTYIRSSAGNGWVAPLHASEEEEVRVLKASDKNHKRLDRSVLLAMIAAKRAIESTQWGADDAVGLYLGSSRGATGNWESFFEQFHSAKKLLPQSSPLTTSGNLATQTAQYLGLNGFSSDNSITCSSALHAIANAIVWLESGRYQRFIAGGTEAPLTPFTVAQMKALKIYSPSSASPSFPNRSLDLNKDQNTLVLGEGSAIFALERSPIKPIVWVSGLGYARENIDSLSGISDNGLALQTAMKHALSEAALPTVDAIVCHCPGTRRGDQSEYAAIQAVFGSNMPALTSNKWKIGHTLGASGGLSLELALLMIMHESFVPIPYLTYPKVKPIRSVMINALGFGGNAVSLIVEATD